MWSIWRNNDDCLLHWIQIYVLSEGLLSYLKSMWNTITDAVESRQRGIKGNIQRINNLFSSMAGLSLHAREEK